MMQSLRAPIAGAVIAAAAVSAAPAVVHAATPRPSVTFTNGQGEEVMKVEMNKKGNIRTIVINGQKKIAGKNKVQLFCNSVNRDWAEGGRILTLTTKQQVALVLLCA